MELDCETRVAGLIAKVFEPEEGCIVIFNGENVKLQTDCGQERTVNGSIMIGFRKCRTMVNNVQYVIELLGAAKLKLEIPQMGAIKKNRTTQELGIHELKMEDIETRLQINRIQTGTKIPTTSTHTMLTVLLIVVLATGVTPATPLTFTLTIAPPATFTPSLHYGR